MELINPTKTYVTTHRLVYSCQYHLIFCPRFRRALLEEALKERLKELLVEGQSRHGYELLEQEVMPAHVHLLLSVNPQIGVHLMVTQSKGYTAYTLRSEFPALKSRLPSLWTRSKFISTVGSVTLEVVKQYIA